MGTIKIPAADVLKKIYGETEESSARYTNLAVRNIIMTRQSSLPLRDVPKLSVIMLTITADRLLLQVSIWTPSVQLTQTAPM